MNSIAYLPITRHSLTIGLGRVALRTNGLRPNFSRLRVFRLRGRLRVWL